LEHKETVDWLYTDFKKVYHSVKRAVLFDILIEFNVPVKLVRTITIV
jgi:hypothetical protein